MNSRYSSSFSLVSAVRSASSRSSNSSVTYLEPLVICCFRFQCSGALVSLIFVTSMNQPICRFILTFNDGIWSSAFSFVSNSANHVWPFVAVSRNSSTLSSKPGRKSPPSRTLSGGSSTNVRRMFSATSCRASRSDERWSNNGFSVSLHRLMMAGIRSSASATANKSLPFERL